MKSHYAVPLLAAAALAQDQSAGPNCGVVTSPPLDDNYPQGTRVIAVAIVAINGTTVALNKTIDTFDGSITAIANLNTAASAVLQDIQQGNTNVSAIPQNPNTPDGFSASSALVSYVNGLACSVNATVDNLIRAKAALVDACIGPVVLQNVQSQQSDSLEFEATVRSKISPLLQGTSDQLVAPINVALSSAVSAFADQTTTPASCGASSTTTAITTTDVTVTTTATTTPISDSSTIDPTTTTSGSGAVEPTLTGTSSTTSTTSGSGAIEPTLTGTSSTTTTSGGVIINPSSTGSASGNGSEIVLPTAGAGGNGWGIISGPIGTTTQPAGGNGWSVIPASSSVVAVPTGGNSGWAVIPGSSSASATPIGGNNGWTNVGGDDEYEDCDEEDPVDAGHGQTGWQTIPAPPKTTNGAGNGGNGAGWQPVSGPTGTSNGGSTGGSSNGGSAGGSSNGGSAGGSSNGDSSSWQPYGGNTGSGSGSSGSSGWQPYGGSNTTVPYPKYTGTASTTRVGTGLSALAFAVAAMML